MHFSTALSRVVLLYILASAHAEVTISDFSGVWKGYADVSQVNVLTPEGPALVCRDDIPPECDEELTPSELTYTFNQTTIAIVGKDRIGMTTVEQSAAAHPKCAKAGIYPFERVITVPPSQITSYNPKEDKMYFIDPRRPDDLNCMRLRYRTGENDPHIEVTIIALYKGSIPNVFALGLSYRCDLLPKRCSVDVNDEGELDLALQDSFYLTCIAGNCSNTARAASPSASDVMNELSDEL